LQRSMLNLTVLGLSLVVAANILPAAHADSNLIKNGDFTLVSNPIDTGIYATASDWTTSGQVVYTNYQTSGPMAAVFNSANQPDGNTLSQSFETQAGHAYTVSYDFGAFGLPGQQIMTASADDGSNVLGSQSEGSIGSNPPNLLAYSFNFVADSALTTLTFNDSGSQTFACDGDVTNVAVRPVPEASTAVLFGLVMVGGLMLVRRQRNAKQTA
jgi:hypothetical protein